jgi:hypothetical protein
MALNLGPSRLMAENPDLRNLAEFIGPRTSLLLLVFGAEDDPQQSYT